MKKNNTKTEEVIDGYDFASIYPNKKCLSSTQVFDYEKDPAKFYIEWVLGNRANGTPAMNAGKLFSMMYENPRIDYYDIGFKMGVARNMVELFEKALKMLPIIKGRKPEYPLKAKYKGWTFRATLDDFIGKLGLIVENKTGKVAWTQARVDTSDQITFQIWCYWKKYSEHPTEVRLNWLDTKQVISPRILSFTTRRTIEQLKSFEKRINLIIEGINAKNFDKPIYDF